jgi:hypothetical protein
MEFRRRILLLGAMLNQFFDWFRSEGWFRNDAW